MAVAGFILVHRAFIGVVGVREVELGLGALVDGGWDWCIVGYIYNIEYRQKSYFKE